MRRIARLRKPSGWRCAAPRQSIAPLSTQCAAAAAAPLSAGRSAARTTTAASTLRFYSQKSPLPQSLAGAQQAASEQVLPEELEAENLELAADNSEILGDVFRPPPKRTGAVIPDKIADPSYTPALSADGLSSVGGLEDWWDRRENWSRSGDFAGFKAKKKIQDPRVLETAVRRAVVEVVALKEAGRESEWVGVWPVGTEEEMARALALDIQSSADGVASLVGDHASIAEDLSWEVQEAREAERSTEEEQEVAVAMPTTEEATAYLKSWDPSWKRFSLADPTIKFAVSTSD